MVELKEHMRVLKLLRIEGKGSLLKLLHHVFTQHALEIRNIDDFIKEVTRSEG